MRKLIIVFLLQLSSAFGQDTLRIYFEYGSSKISFLEEQKLKKLPKDFDLSSVEYAEFIGYADSTGNFHSNIRLSEKRAKNVYKETKRSFNSTVEIVIKAKGEGAHQNQNENRRVEVVLHYPIQELEEEPPVIIENVDPRCFFVDLDALKYCNTREITKRKRKYIYIEALDVGLFQERKHYYALKDYRGKVTIQQVRWKRKTTGKLWWRKTRLVAMIPKASFDQYQFFTLEDAPCGGCTEEIFTKDTIILNTFMSYPDYFLMSNMQAKLRIFNQQQLKIRVPKEYVNLNDDYYFDYQPGVTRTYTNQSNRITWGTKRFGKKRQDYYYTKLWLRDSQMPYIKHIRPSTICLNDREWNGGYRNPWMCGGVVNGGWALGLMGSLEPGVFYHNDTLTGYLAAGITFVNQTNINIQAGINTRQGFYGAANFRYPITSFRIRALSIKNKWENPFDRYGGNFSSPYLHFYAGLDTKTSFNRKYQSFFEGNLHLGFNIRPYFLKIFPSFYIQAGASYDFMKRINTKIYPYAQFGIRFFTRSFI